MLQFIKKPHLPENKVAAVIMSDVRKDVFEELQRNYHMEVMVPEPLAMIKGAERYHADMSVCHLGENQFVIAEENASLQHWLLNAGAEVILCGNITAKTPRLNACFLGEKLLCHSGKADGRILEYASHKGMKVLHTNQYYTKCSVAIVSDRAVMTADPSVISLCHKHDIDVLTLSPGEIQLDGYDYGFIGGCCGFLDKKVMGFSGKLSAHPDGDRIRSFLRNYGIEAADLSSEPLYDIGGILPVMEL